jgi:hypothetical protein
MSKHAFVYTDKVIPLTTLNKKSRKLTSERRADLDEKHEVVAKAVKIAFGRGKEMKPVVPKASPRANELRAEAAAAAKVRATENKPAK